MKTIEKLALARKQVTAWEKRKAQAIRVLVKAEAKLPMLAKAVKRLEARRDREMVERAMKLPDAPKEVQEMVAAAIGPTVTDDLAIPGFLQRNPKDAETAAKLKAEHEAKKTEKARVRIEHMKAKKAGVTKRMPLSGKAALAAIKDETLSLGYLGPLP